MAHIWLRFRICGAEISMTLGMLLLIVALFMIGVAAVLGWKGGR